MQNCNQISVNHLPVLEDMDNEGSAIPFFPTLSFLAVTRSKNKEGAKLFSAFHPPEYIKHVLLADFEILLHIDDPRPYNLLQDIWVARKNPSSDCLLTQN